MTTPEPELVPETDPVAEMATIEEIPPSAVPAPSAAPATSSSGRSRPRLPRPGRGFGSGVAAVGVKELRGRMRGRRAFVILTIYLLLLAGFAWMIELLMERTYQSGFGMSGAYASAQIGQIIFAALLMLETLQVVFLAPASTAGAISLEREKQTLDMLTATPITSVAIVVGKLLSALVYVFLLIAASIPLMAVVFVYGGVGPEDMVRGYLVLLATALGLGAFGLFCSSLARRTQAATAISIFGVLSITVGTVFLLTFWVGVANSGGAFQNGMGPIKGKPPQVLAYVNPFIAQADVLCGTEATYGAWCGIVSGLTGTQNDGGVIVTDTIGGGAMPVPQPAVVGRFAPDVVAFGGQRATVWPMSVVTWLVLAGIFLILSIQLVSPTRRWRPRRRRRAPTEVPA